MYSAERNLLIIGYAPSFAEANWLQRCVYVLAGRSIAIVPATRSFFHGERHSNEDESIVAVLLQFSFTFYFRGLAIRQTGNILKPARYNV